MNILKKNWYYDEQIHKTYLLPHNMKTTARKLFSIYNRDKR